MQTGQIINEMLPSHAALSKGLMEMLLKLGGWWKEFWKNDRLQRDCAKSMKCSSKRFPEKE